MPSWSLLFPDWPHPASLASIPRPGRRLCRGERDTRPPALPAGWCQVFTWGELSAGAWFPELAAGTGHAPPRAPPRWGMAMGPSPSGAASVTCGPQRSIQGPHLRMEGIQEAAWEKEREDAFVGPGSSERPELRAAARGRGWRVGGTARVRPPARGDGGLCSEPARAEHLSLVGSQRGRCRGGEGRRMARTGTRGRFLCSRLLGAPEPAACHAPWSPWAQQPWQVRPEQGGPGAGVRRSVGPWLARALFTRLVTALPCPVLARLPEPTLSAKGRVWTVPLQPHARS